MKVYVAGPMTGYPLYNFPAFEGAAGELRRQGHEVVSPHELDQELGVTAVTRSAEGEIVDVRKTESFDYNEVLRHDLAAISRCDAVFTLTGWRQSRGATMEVAHAVKLGLDVWGAELAGLPLPASAPPLVGLLGFAGAGKDAFAAALGYRRIAFADPLRELAMATGIGVPDPVTGHVWDLGGAVLLHGWDRMKRDVPAVRELLQNLGVGVREVLGADTWVRAALAKYDPSVATVFTDVRFPNEIAALRDRGAVIVRVDRPGTGAANDHVSEHAWQIEIPDYVIENSGTLADLADAAATLDKELRG